MKFFCIGYQTKRMSFYLQLNKLQVATFTKILDAMSQYLEDVILECHLKGIYLINKDDINITILASFISSDWFEKYQFQSNNPITCGFNIKSVYQILKQNGKSDSILIFNQLVDSDNQLVIETKQLNGKRVCRFNIDCFDVELDIKIEDTLQDLEDYPVKLDFLTNDFKGIIDQIKILKTDNILLTYNNDNLILELDKRAKITQEVSNTILDANIDHLIINLGTEKIIQLNRCLNISDQLEIFLKEDYPFYINFPIEHNSYLLVGISLRNV